MAVKQAEADLLSSQESLARGRATVGASEAALRRAKDALVSLEAEVRRTESEVEWAKSELERNGTLFRGGLIAARDVDNARNLHNVAVSRMAVAISARDQHPDQMRMAEAQVDSDRAALRVAEAEVARREPTLGIAVKRLGDTTIRAPFAGLIAKRLVNAGEYVKENTPLFNLVAVDPLKYAGTVPERFAPDLRIGQRIELTVEAYPGRSFAGQVTRVSPAVSELRLRSRAERCGNSSLRDIRGFAYLREAGLAHGEGANGEGGDTGPARASALGRGSSGGAQGRRASVKAGQPVSSGRGGPRLSRSMRRNSIGVAGRWRPRCR
jgi:multidrug resistance efflux pump